MSVLIEDDRSVELSRHYLMRGADDGVEETTGSCATNYVIAPCTNGMESRTAIEVPQPEVATT